MNNQVQTSDYFYGLEIMQHNHCLIEHTTEMQIDPRYQSILSTDLINEYDIQVENDVAQQLMDLPSYQMFIFDQSVKTAVKL